MRAAIRQHQPAESVASIAPAGRVATAAAAVLAGVNERRAVLDATPDTELDDIARLAARLCCAPVALITFVEPDRQVFKARFGLDLVEAPRDFGFCPLVAGTRAMLVVPDAAADPRHAGNPALVAHGLRFYAGVPLVDAFGMDAPGPDSSGHAPLPDGSGHAPGPDSSGHAPLPDGSGHAPGPDGSGHAPGPDGSGHPPGTLCVLDRVARSLTADQLDGLRVLARQVLGRLELRLALVRERTANHRRRAIFASELDLALIATDPAGLVTDWSTGATRIFGGTAEQMRGRSIVDIFTPEDQAQDRAATEMHGALAVGHARDDRWHLRQDGTRVWVTGEMLALRAEDGGILGFLKVVRDRTIERHAAEELRVEADRYAALTRMQRELVAAPAGDLDAMLGMVTDRALALVPHADGAVVELCEDDELVYRAGSGLSLPFVGLRLERSGSLSGLCIALGQPLRADDTELDDRVDRAACRRTGVRAMIVVPIQRHGTIIGVLKLRSAHPNSFTEPDVTAALMLVGVLAGGFGHVAEVTAMAALGASEARFRELADNMSQFAWTADATGWLNWYNQRWYDYTGTTFDDMQGWGWSQVHHPDHLQRVIDKFNASLASGEPWEDTFPLRGKDGVFRWFLSRARPIRDQTGAVVRWFGTNTDVTELRDAKAALGASEAKFQAIVDSIDQMIWSADAEGRHDYYNQRWYDYTGLTPNAALASRADGATETLFHPDDYARTRSSWLASLATGAPYEVEYRMRHRSGDYRWVLGRAQALRGPAADGRAPAILRWYGTCTDIHDRKMAEAALRQLNETLEQRVAQEVAERGRAEAALRQSQKMEAVGQLTGGLAHDFNNLLTGISGSLELIQSRIAQGRFGQLERYIGAAQVGAKRAAALTHRLLAFSRRQTLDPHPISLNRLVAGMEELVRRTVGPGITVEVVAAAGLWSTRVDPNQLENALLNLCINARDAMPDGGRLTIETANRRLDASASSQLDLPAGPFVALCVSDTGTGMTAEVAARAFDPFFTTKPLGQGTGLGLSMIYGFARQSGGQARLYSEVGQGTTACIYLPRYQAPDEAAEPEHPAGLAEITLTGRTVLVVDDEAAVRMLVTDALDDLGYHSIEAEDGRAALQVLQSDARIDLLVTDVGLPGGLNGRQVADAGQALRPDLKVLFMTGYAENAAVGDGHLRPGMQVLTKPFAMADLAGRVRDLVMPADQARTAQADNVTAAAPSTGANAGAGGLANGLGPSLS